MRHALDTLAGLLELARLGLITRFRFRGPYWTWRLSTAYGRGRPTGPELRREVLAYARWARRMRRMM